MGHITVFTPNSDFLDLHCLDEDNDDKPYKYDWFVVPGRGLQEHGFSRACVGDLDIDTIPVPWAYIDEDAEWHEVEGDRTPEWQAEVRAWLHTLPADTWITVADVHI